MGNRIGGWVIAVLALLLAWPVLGHAQDVAPTPFTAFLSHPRYEDGGFFVGIDFLYLRSENTIGTQSIAKRGFVDVDGSITGKPGQYVGDEKEALNTQQLHGPRSYQPGFDLTFGWRFEDGFVLQLSWWHLTEQRLFANANIIPAGFQVGAQLQNTFLFSPVFNFPIQYGGNPQNLTVGNPGATFGIWNAASEMNISLVQRFEKVDFGGRMPMIESEGFRCFGNFGARAVIMWERFFWRTVSSDVNGQAVASDVANYSNIVSNRLYGPFAGVGVEWFLGNTPIGGFSFSLDVEGALYLDIVKERARWELADRSTAARRARNTYHMSPGAQGKVSLWWYPWEAITFHFGWDALLFFNTVASREPVDFNFSSVDPEFNSGVVRYFHGLQLGVGLVF